jgi:hypothetical protein
MQGMEDHVKHARWNGIAVAVKIRELSHAVRTNEAFLPI